MKVLDRRTRIEATGAEAVFVVYDEPERLRRGILRDLDPSFPILLDPDRRAYAEWGLARASIAQVWLDPKVLRTYARMFLREGQRPARMGKDTLQLGGDFVVGAGGRLVYSRPQERDDRPAVGVLLKVLEEAGGSAEPVGDRL